MSFENPTPLRLGMSGHLAGTHYRVLGRVVMGMEDQGETFHWNEFNLADDQGESATLVYEETEQGGEWRLFTLFEPEYAITAEDAATKRVGDPLNLDGTQVRVTLVDESRVYHIEGQAPEGVEVGDVAHYFNAEAGNTMQVVSWSGDEVECYRGVDLPRDAVARAFGFPAESRSLNPSSQPSSFLSSALSPQSDERGSRWLLIATVALLGLALLFGIYSCAPSRRRATIGKTAAPAITLAVGKAGTLEVRKYRIQSHAVVECAQVARLYDWHEYDLLDEAGNGALLICGLDPGKEDCFLFSELEPVGAFTPEQAAAVRVGQSVNINGIVAPATALFQCAIRRIEGPEILGANSGDIFYGFIAQTGSVRLLVRWNVRGIVFREGKAVPVRLVAAEFGEKSRD